MLNVVIIGSVVKSRSLLYEQQLNQKENKLKKHFKVLGGFIDFKLNEIKSADRIYNYRNKMEFTFSPNRWVLESEPEGVR